MKKTYGTPHNYSSLIRNRIMARFSRTKHTKNELKPIDISLIRPHRYPLSTSLPSTTSSSSSDSSSASTADTSLNSQLEVFTYPTNTLPVLFDDNTKPAYDTITTDPTLRDTRHYSTLISVPTHFVGTPHVATVYCDGEYTYRDALDDRLRFKVRNRSGDSGELSNCTTLFVPEECGGCHVGVGLCEDCGIERIGELDRQTLWLEEERRMSERRARQAAEWKDEGCVVGDVTFAEVKWA